MAVDEPFILSKRKNSPYFQVRFKNPDKSSKERFLPAKSTKETVRSRAIAKAWSMYNEETVTIKSAVQSIRYADLSDTDIQKLVQILKDRGIDVNTSGNTEKLLDFLLTFWDADKSPYIAEKKRMNRHIGISYIFESRKAIENYWCKFFPEDKLLSNVTRKDLKDFIEFVDKAPMGWSRKLKVYRAGSIALKWAFMDEQLDKDVTAGIVSFSGKANERKILTREMAELIFSIKWSDERCQLANLVAMLTGMRSGEIIALRKQDLGKDVIYVRHSWEVREGLKTPKNGEERKVYFPFPQITQKLLYLADMNGGRLDSFIFFAPLSKNKPMDKKILNQSLKKQMRKVGIAEEDCKQICFHSWRHFYTTYMSEKVNQRILQTQTGHKTLAMLEHYGNHSLESDINEIETAQIELFNDIVNNMTL